MVLAAGLGTKWEILENGFKYYPSILASHAPIGATLELVSRIGKGTIATVRLPAGRLIAVS